MPRTWRHIVAAAVADGDKAEVAISKRDLDALMALPADRRREVLDREVDDPRLANLVPEDLKALRESIGPPKIDLTAMRAGSRARQVAALDRYITAYRRQLRAAIPDIDLTPKGLLARIPAENAVAGKIAQHYLAARRERAALAGGRRHGTTVSK